MKKVQAILGLLPLAFALLYITALSSSPAQNLWPAREHWEGALVAGVCFVTVCIIVAFTTPKGR